ncbi:MAG: hypothetical protein ACJAW3_000034 [Lentimonas sp.]|jgi:hypothetical protein
MTKKSILFIVEKNVISGRSDFGSSNDLLLIYQALCLGFDVFLATPSQLHLNSSKINDFPALKILHLNQAEMTRKIIRSFKKQVVNCFLAINDLSAKEDSKIMLEGAKLEKINLEEMPIFNRAEPVSLSSEFYETLIKWQKFGLNILPDPFLNKIFGDKLAIHLIHQNEAFAGIDLLKNVKFGKGENEISLKTKIVKISNENLSAAQIFQFHNLLKIGDLKQAEKLFADEFNIFQKGVSEYLDFHQYLDNDSIIKPLNYFGGTGIVVAKNQVLDFNSAVQNVVKSFLALREDCQKSGNENLAFLPEIIIQERATRADEGDLRILFCAGELQDIFVRVNPDFAKFGANNFHHGGHAESLFKHYNLSKKGIDEMAKDGADADKTQALYGLLKTLNFLKRIEIFKKYPIIGADALLTKGIDGALRYAINEINLTSPMGQVQSLQLNIAVKLSDFAVQTLNENGFKISLEKWQIVADYFTNSDLEEIKKAQEILFKNQSLESSVEEEIEKSLLDDFSAETINQLANYFKE